MTASALSVTLRELADFAEIRGASVEASEWRRVAAQVEHGGSDAVTRLTERARLNRLSDIASVHPTLQSQLREILVDGPELAISAARSSLPWLLRRLLQSAAVDSAGLAALARNGIVTATDLSLALQDGRITSGQLAAYADRLRFAEEMLKLERPRVSLGRAVELLDNLMLLFAAACPNLEDVTPAGDVRRVEPIVDALVVVGHAADPPAALETVSQLATVRIPHRTDRRALVVYHHTEVDVRIVTPDEFGTALHEGTGSDEHLLAMRRRHGSPPLSGREVDVYAHAGLPWIPPELRHGRDEIGAAEEGRLPVLVAREDIRGDFHMHTTYSDGRDSLAEMAAVSAALGYEYIAITDHSERAGAPKTVTRDALVRQRDEIASLRDRFPRLTILHGVEVDIMPDGSLDFPDDVLETLDIVLASLHDHCGHDPARLTRRCLAAIQHPLVNIITHPANRLVGRDAGHALDFAAIYAAAASTATALEIDGAPTHLDLDGDRAREAVAAGVTVAIDSDCHRARLLDRQMRFGVGTARRGWVEPRHVLNTRPIDEVRAFLAAKRQARR